MIGIPLSWQALRKRTPSTLISVSSPMSTTTGHGASLTLRFDLVKVFDVELADQLHDQRVS